MDRSEAKRAAFDKMEADMSEWVLGTMQRVIDDCEDPPPELADWVKSRFESAIQEASAADSEEDRVMAAAEGLADIIHRLIDDCDLSDETHEWLTQQGYILRKATEIAEFELMWTPEDD